MKIAIIDDDRRQAREIEDALSCDEHRCHLFYDWDDFTSLPVQGRYDALILSRRGRDRDDREIMSWLRSANPMPVLVLADQSTEDEVVAWLNAGAADLIVPPTTPRAISARVKALTRRYAGGGPSQELKFGDYAFHPGGRAVVINGELVPLTEKEFMLSLMLFRNSNNPISRETIYERIWKYKSTASSRTVDTHVARIRKKLKLFPGGGFPLISIYGKGYMIVQSFSEGSLPWATSG
ncbi:response regulator transcription factor [Caulobacter mirabilis]|uniref:DNA-binding response regulator n=1 Tax=Caulobacter mirabilis TaxID=69666 RepID=A0A2D2B2Z0_9CAUL|nr:response regulator transcription factor [Caulobacter mirabilis]ATQ44607.1 hypothetical protein CSW64_20530 [Caulobacter mirabilis]